MRCIRSPFFLLMAVLMAACTQNLDIPFPEHQPRLTLNSFLVEGGTPFLDVTRSFSALETITDSAILIKDAQVELWKEGNKLANFRYVDSVRVDTILRYEIEPGRYEYVVEVNRKGFYTSEEELEALQVLETYEFRASHPTYGEAMAQSIIVPKPNILGVQLGKDSIVTRDFDDGYQDKWTAVKIQVQDPGEIGNYYNFIARIAFSDTVNVGLDTLYNFDVVSTEIVREADGIVYGENAAISDEEFDGQVHTLTVFIRLPGCCGYAEDLAREDNYVYHSVELEAFLLDANYGIFQKKRELQRYNRTEGIEGALIPTEPVVVSGNVLGGYGLVGSFNSLQWEARFP